MEAIFHIKNRRGEADEHINLYQGLVFGRGKKANISITDETISGAHCRITFKADRMEIVDLGSKNGTYLNGIRIVQSEIFVGDEIRIGETIITFNEGLMSADVLALFTFPGPFKDRISYELKADFTGARIQNQLYLKQHPGEIHSAYQAREIVLRRKANSKIRLSKEEIKSNHKVLSLFSFSIDMALLIGIILMPIFLVNEMSVTEQVKLVAWELPGSSIAENKLTILAALEVLGISLYLSLNSKLLRFTIGEKLTGIEDLYSKQ